MIRMVLFVVPFSVSYRMTVMKQRGHVARYTVIRAWHDAKCGWYAVTAFEGITERQWVPPTLPMQLIAAISHWSPLLLCTRTPPRSKFKHLSTIFTTRISDRVKLLIDKSFDQLVASRSFKKPLSESNSSRLTKLTICPEWRHGIISLLRILNERRVSVSHDRSSTCIPRQTLS